MPEMLTKYPDDALKILKDANIKCGTGEHQQILTWCPKENFCSLPTGEICVFGTNNMANMMQVGFFDVVSSYSVFVPMIAIMLVIFAGGVLFGRTLRR